MYPGCPDRGATGAEKIGTGRVYVRLRAGLRQVVALAMPLTQRRAIFTRRV